METYPEKLGSALREILQKNEDAVKGYEKAAENAKEIGLQSYFQNKSKERLNFIASLRAALPNIDLGNREIQGSTTAAMHRTWMDVKAFFSGDDDEAMLEEAIKGDKAAVEEYEEILDDIDLPPAAAEVIRQQMNWINNDLSEIKTMEEVR
ncbi:ferritin-like domain-containing protein [Ulvibacterium marinum]|uniref:PA2169 family four-helix-bundle protein n=1 Tax=Ulvibacterium marinum TaxID=2419782 RepID=A0A3B0CEG8_9FLAO|nr:PA2169 family four-helix-bundle protein [Ulvibacterium marinum]RKN83491.1 PA2169 family four-helix-bundle protein [Ulvibacterium marinum]